MFMNSSNNPYNIVPWCKKELFGRLHVRCADKQQSPEKTAGFFCFLHQFKKIKMRKTAQIR